MINIVMIQEQSIFLKGVFFYCQLVQVTIQWLAIMAFYGKIHRVRKHDA